MAIVTKIEKGGIKSRSGRQTNVECNYFINDKDGRKYLQLDTYGSEAREIKGKTSQTLLFSPDAIKQLKELFAKEFNT